jgi:hypothetical protein
MLVLIFSAAALGSMALPWVADDSGTPTSGWDMLLGFGWDLLVAGGDDLGEPMLQLGVCTVGVMLFSVVLMGFSFAGLLDPKARLTVLSLVFAVMLAVCAGLALEALPRALHSPDMTAMKAGPFVAAVTALLCAVSACFGPHAQKALRAQEGEGGGRA